MKKISIDLESVDAALALAELSADHKDGSSVKNNAKLDWDLNAGWHGALELARHGWPAGLAQVSELSGNVSASSGAAFGRVLEYDVAGDWIDVGRYVEGVPDCAVAVRRRPVVSRVVKIVANITCAGQIPADWVLRRGAAIIELVDLLENSGVRCELWACVASVRKFHASYFNIKLKAADDGLDRDRLAFWLCHAAAGRRIGFALREGLPAEYRKAIGYSRSDGAYGSPTDAIMPCDILLGVVKHNDQAWVCAESVRGWVLARASEFVKLD
jgi:hypothetical protein